MLPENDSEWLGWLLTQPQATAVSLIVFCTSKSIDTVQAREGVNDQAATLINALDLDLADWWSATADTYVSRVLKAKMIEAVTEAVNGQAANDMGKMKKAEAVAYASAQLAQTRWLPSVLRRAPVVAQPD